MAGFKDGKLNANYTPYSTLCAGATNPGIIQSVVSPGTSGQSLTSNGVSALPSYQNAVNGSVEWETITSGSLPSASSLSITTGLGSAFDNYQLIVKDVTPNTGTVQFLVSTSVDAGATYTVSTNFFGLNAGTTQSEETPPMSLSIGGFTSSSSPSIFVQWNANNLSAFKPCWAALVDAPSGSTTLYNGFWETTSDIDAIQMALSSGTFATGTYELQGK